MSMREGVASLYRGLSATSASDPTYHKDRMAALDVLGLLGSQRDTILGSDAQFDSAKAGLGLFARNRGLRQVQKKEEKSHREVVMEQQNLRRRLAYSKALNGIVTEMGEQFMNDEPIPLQTWTTYDRMRRDPAYAQKSKAELDNPGCKEPGPGAYLDLKGGTQVTGKRDQALPVTFGKSERWRKDNSAAKEAAAAREAKEIKKAAREASTMCLRQKRGMRWSSHEREKLNDLYWELGRPRKRAFFEDHVNLYADRHRVLFSNRPKEEIVERVTYMLKHNQFKERGEIQHWEGKKAEKETKMRRPGKNQRAMELAKKLPPRETRSARMQRTGTMQDHTFGPDSFPKDESATQKRTRNRPLPAPPAPLPPAGQDSFRGAAGSMYGGRMSSPFTTGLSQHTEAPGFSFPSAGRNLSLVKEAKNDEASEPPGSSSIGVQLLSDNKTMPALSFKKAGVGGVNLGVGEEEASNEPTATTYHPQFQAVQPRIPAYGLSDRLGDGEVFDKTATYRGPGSYEEGGSVGLQALASRKNAPRTTFSTVDRLKFMSDFAIA